MTNGVEKDWSGNVMDLEPSAQKGVSNTKSVNVSYFADGKRVNVPVVSWHIDHERPIIDHTVFGPNAMTYYVNYSYDEDGHFYRNWKSSIEFIVSLSEREKYFFRRWQRRAKPTWRKPQRMAYPSGRHRNRKK